METALLSALLRQQDSRDATRCLDTSLLGTASNTVVLRFSFLLSILSLWHPATFVITDYNFTLMENFGQSVLSHGSEQPHSFWRLNLYLPNWRHRAQWKRTQNDRSKQSTPAGDLKCTKGSRFHLDFHKSLWEFKKNKRILFSREVWGPMWPASLQMTVIYWRGFSDDVRKVLKMQKAVWMASHQWAKL